MPVPSIKADAGYTRLAFGDVKPDALANLSPREREIARLAVRGLSNKEIAQVLDISPWTVSTHLRRVFDKLGVHRRVALAMLFAPNLHLP